MEEGDVPMSVGETTQSDHLPIIRKLLKENIMDLMLPSLFEKEEAEVYKLFRRLVDNGESNSALLIGPRGCGKTTLVNKALNQLKEECDTFSDCVVVRLSGYVHTDDRLALKGMAVQMQLENCDGDQVFGSFAENLSFLLQCLREGDRHQSKSVLIILDEFDLFCHHHNQTLLYNLFDVAQSAQAPICVLGVSCRYDVVDLLEKRVKSRFSNRKIYLHTGTEAEVKSYRLNGLENLLSIHEKFGLDLGLSSGLIRNWNKKIRHLCNDPTVVNCVKSMCEWGYCERVFRNSLFAVVSKLGCNHREIVPTDFEEINALLHQNRRVSLLEGLSVLEICLVISMMHHTLIYDSPFNFELVFFRLLKFDRGSNKLNVEREVSFKAFEHLKSIELLLPTSSSSKVSKEFQMFRLVVLPEEVQKAVSNRKTLPYEVVQWAQSDLT